MGSSFAWKYNQKLTSLPYTLNGTNDSEIWRGIARVWPQLLHGFSWLMIMLVLFIFTCVLQFQVCFRESTIDSYVTPLGQW